MSQSTLSIIAVGDISLSGIYRNSRFKTEVPWQSLQGDWNNADLRIGNLEAPITDADRVANSKFSLRAGKSAIDILNQSSFDLLSMANNHAMDFGKEGLINTMKVLRECSIPFVGCGVNAEEAAAPEMVTRNDQRVGFISFCDVEQISPLYADSENPGVSKLDEKSVERVQRLRSEVDWLIVQLHWGTEMCCLPSPDQRAMAQKFVDAGADAIICHHPHVVQPYELIDDIPVWYSLGNFSFSNEFWRGVDRNGKSFVGEYKIHPLARQSIVAHMKLCKSKPPVIDVQHVSIHKNGMIRADKDPAARNEFWEDQVEALHSTDYEDRWQSEFQAAETRRKWQTRPGSFINRLS